jgi:hypothetical protein
MASNLRARVVIQNRDSLLYFQGDGQWTPDINKAVDFERLLQAREMARQIDHTDLEIIMNFGEPEYDLRFKIRP